MAITDTNDLNNLITLTDSWTDMASGLWEDYFDLDSFKNTVRDTVTALVKHNIYSDEFPREIVSLLLAVKEFQCGPVIGKESEVALNIAWALCDVENCCNIFSDGPEAEERLFIEVGGKTKVHKIYIDEFDITELMADT